MKIVPLTYSGTTLATTLSVGGCIPFTSLPLITHTYSYPGAYTITVSASNPASSLVSYSMIHNVIELPSGPMFSSAIPTILFPFPETSFGFRFTSGTQLTLQGFLNGTISSNFSYNSSSRSGVIVFSAGTLGGLGDFSLQLLYVSPLTNPSTINTIVSVDTLIPSATLIGSQIALLPTSDPNIANHIVALNFGLCYTNGALVPYRQWMNISFGDGTVNNAYSFQCDSSQSNQCPSNYSFCSYTPSRNYSTSGNLTVSVSIYNLLSSRTVIFNFFIYSQITGLRESLFVMPLGATQTAPNTSNYWPLINSPYYPIEQSVWLIASMAYGGDTPATYWWSFGDGNSTVTSNPYVQYTYSNPGLYIVSLNASNPLSSIKTSSIFNQLSSSSSVTDYIIVQRFVLLKFILLVIYGYV